MKIQRTGGFTLNPMPALLVVPPFGWKIEKGKKFLEIPLR
jgi:hypothetical protein